MAGYTRQSVADIVNGENITAPPLNAELNQIQLAFAHDQGHTHDGSVGSGPKIDLTTSITGVLPAQHGGTGGKNLLDAVIDPTQTDDANLGYARGSIWINSNTNKIYLALDVTVGSAIWVEVVVVNGQNQILPQSHGIVDLGSTTLSFRDIFLTGSISAAEVDAAIGSNTPSTVAATDITADTVTATPVNNEHTIFGNLQGNATGNFKGDIYSTNDTLILNNGTDGTDASFIGSVSGDITSTGTSTFATLNATDITATAVTATFTGDITGNVTGDVTGNVTGNVTGDLTGNVTGDVTGNTTGSHTGPIDANNNRILNVADPVDTSDGLSLGYFNTVLSGSEQGIAGSLADARDARDDAQGYRDETLGYRNEAETFRDEAEAARDVAQNSEQIAIQKAGEVSILFDSSQYAQRLIGSLI